MTFTPLLLTPPLAGDSLPGARYPTVWDLSCTRRDPTSGRGADGAAVDVSA